MTGGGGGSGAAGDMELVEGARLEVMMSPGAVSDGHQWLQATVLALGASPRVATAVRELLNPWDGWTIGGQKVSYARSTNAQGQEPEPGEVAVLLLDEAGEAAVAARLAVAKPLAARPERPMALTLGEPVGVLASPFGALSPSIFLNSVSTGVVSNFVLLDAEKPGEEPEVALVLTDARCLPCSEGAPVIDEAGALIGLVLPELQQRNGQVVGYSLVAPIDCLRPFLATCADLLGGPPATGVRMVAAAAASSQEVAVSGGAGARQPYLPGLSSAAPPPPVLPAPVPAGRFPQAAIDKAGRSLAMVCVGSSWASGG
eukprot:SAG22_NODE_425_length_10628_cov_3.420458_5_plen_315_part_00